MLRGTGRAVEDRLARVYSKTNQPVSIVGKAVATMSGEQASLPPGVQGVVRLFEASCEAFREVLGQSEAAADAVDFTGHLHDLSLTAGRVQALGEALTALTGNPLWVTRAEEVLRSYLSPDYMEPS
jgi:hypothetical protein